MHGVGESTAAITIVNALSTGVGAAAGIEMTARAEVTLHPAGSTGKWEVRVDDANRTPLVIASLTGALRRFAPGSSGSAELTVRSEIPVARGLKSSSAVSSAVVLAVARATDVDVSRLEVARLSAEIAISSGVSATGAFDDALAGLSEGIVVTDNRRQELLSTLSFEPELGLVLYIPRATHRPSPEWSAAFRSESRTAQTAVDAVLRGDWVRAMTENTRLVERVMRYDYDSLRTKLHQRGAVAAGVSGMGPALAAVAPRTRLRELLAALPTNSDDRDVFAFSSRSRPAPDVAQ